MSEVPSLTEILDKRQDNTMRALRVCEPARIESYDDKTQKCSVQPLIYEGEINPQDGERVVSRPPVITDVPVMHLGGNGFQITVPIKAGDLVLIVYCDRSLDRWLVRGGEVDPADDRTHHTSDAIAIPGLRDFAHALATAPTDRIRIGASTGAAKIDITSTQIEAGGASALALLNDLDILKTAIASAAVSGGDGGATFKTNIGAYLTSHPFAGTTVLKGG